MGSLLLLVPWGAVFEWTMRLGGLAVLGPHMYWIGKHIKAESAAFDLESAAFDSATPRERRQTLATHRERMKQEAIERLHVQTKTKEGLTAAIGPDGAPMPMEDDTDDADEAASSRSSESPASKKARLQLQMQYEKSTRTMLKEQSYYTLLVRPRPTAGTLRSRFRADLQRSHAYPLFPAEDRPAEEEEDLRTLTTAHPAMEA